MTREDMLQLAKGFAALAPTRVLWAITKKGLPQGVSMEDLQLGPNTMVTPWVDYNVSMELQTILCQVADRQSTAAAHLQRLLPDKRRATSPHTWCVARQFAGCYLTDPSTCYAVAFALC